MGKKEVQWLSNVIVSSKETPREHGGCCVDSRNSDVCSFFRDTCKRQRQRPLEDPAKLEERVVAGRHVLFLYYKSLTANLCSRRKGWGISYCRWVIVRWHHPSMHPLHCTSLWGSKRLPGILLNVGIEVISTQEKLLESLNSSEEHISEKSQNSYE